MDAYLVMAWLPMQVIPHHRLLVGGVLIALGFVITCKILSSLIMFQITESLPKGIYTISPPQEIDYGTLVVFDIPPQIKGLMHARGWLLPNLKFYLMKPVAAKPGDSVEVSEAGVFINGRFIGPIARHDAQGLPLSLAFQKHILDQGEYFVATSDPNSFDSRYFGTIPAPDIKWAAKPLLVFGGR